MMFKTILATAMVMVFALHSHSQEKIVPLKPGDTVPDLILTGFLDEPGKQNKISELLNQLLLIDFWNVSCGACIVGMPRLDSLQKQFGEKIRIILVTRNSPAEVKKLFSHIKIRKPQLPMVVSNRELERYFPLNTVPHHVWIGPDRVVRYITDGYNASADNIRDFLAGKTLPLHYKNENADFNYQASLLTEGGGELLKNIRQYSVITNRIEEYGGNLSGWVLNSEKQVVGVKLMNVSLLELYQTAFGEGMVNGQGKFDFQNRIVLEVKEPERFMNPVNEGEFDDWTRKNLFGYEARLPTPDKGKLFEMMRDDLARFFPFRVTVEMRRMRSWVLVKLPGPDLIATRVPNNSPVDTGRMWRNVPFTTFYQRLYQMSYSFKYPLGSAIEYGGNIDFEFPDEPNDVVITPEIIKRSLNRYGLDLVEKDWLMEMLIIRDRLP